MRRAVILGALLFLIVTAAWWFLLMSAKSSDINDLDEQRATAESTELNLISQRDQLEALAAREGEYSMGLGELRTSIPIAPDGASLIERFNEAVIEADVDLISLSPQIPVPSRVPGLFEISIEMSFEGPYFKVLPLLLELESLPRLVRIDSITVNATPLEDGTNLLSVSLTAVAFSLTDLDGSVAEEAA